jgi:metallophosphoesterase superfamily enzyme
MSRILEIGDPHEPVGKKGYLEFCQKTCKEYGCNRIVLTGDICDWHGISFHAREPGAPGVVQEFELAFERIQKWYKAFPEAIVTIGNHDNRIIRLAASVDIPARFIRDYAEIWETPGWDWVFDTIIDDVYHFHGDGYGGMYPAYNVAKQMGMSVVMGHVHAAAGIKWLVSPRKRWFGMDVGCGIDDKKYAFAYNKRNKKRSAIACGVVIDGHPYHEMMPLEDYK